MEIFKKKNDGHYGSPIDTKNTKISQLPCAVSFYLATEIVSAKDN